MKKARRNSGSAPLSSDKKLVEQLWKYGYFRCPEQNVGNVKREDLVMLTAVDTPVREAVIGFQKYFKGSLDHLVMLDPDTLRLESYADGDASKNTKALLFGPRCQHPDFDVSIEDDPEVGRLWSRAEANWPTDCRGKLKMSRSFDSLRGLTEKQTTDVWWASCNNWMHVCPDMRITAHKGGSKNEYDVWSDAGPLPGSTLAWSELARSNCQITLSQMYDTTINWQMQGAVTTKSHEDGHAWGHNHVRDGSALMYPMINSAAKSRWGLPNSTDLDQAKRLGYQVDRNVRQLEPTAEKLFNPKLFFPTDDPGPGPGPGPDPDVVVTTSGAVVVKVGDRSYAYSLKPTIEV